MIQTTSFLLLLFLLSLAFIYKIELENKSLIRLARQYECIALYHNQLETHLKKMEEINSYIRVITRTNMIVSIVLPGFSVAGKVTSQKLRKALELYQMKEVISFSKNRWDLKQKNCPITTTSIISPFIFGNDLKPILQRDFEGAAKLRRMKWRDFYLLEKNHNLFFTYTISNQTKLIREVSLF